MGLSAGKDAGIEGVQGNLRFLPPWFVIHNGFLGFSRCVLSNSTSEVEGSITLFWALISWFTDGVLLLGPLGWLNLGYLFLFPFGSGWFVGLGP